MRALNFFEALPPRWTLLLLASAFFLRLFLAPSMGFKADMDINLAYGKQAVAHGLTSVPDLFAGTDSEMLPPLFIYQDALVHHISQAQLAAIESQHPDVAATWERVRFKMLPITYDLLTGLVILLVLAALAPPPWPLLGAALYLFNPCVFLNSSVWGQFDSVHCFFMLLVVVCCAKAMVSHKRLWWVLAWMMGALAFGSKLQSIVILPLLAVWTVSRAKPRDAFLAVVAGALTLLALYAPFLLAHRWDYLDRVFVRSFTRYGFTQINAFNVWALGFTAPSGTTLLGLSYARLGQLGYLACLLWLCSLVFKASRSGPAEGELWRQCFVAGAYASVAPFMVLTAMHERYIAPAIAFLILAACVDRRLRWPAAGYSLTYALNMYYVLRLINLPAEQLPAYNAGNFALRVFGSLFNVAMFVWFSARLPGLLRSPPLPDRTLPV